MLNEILWVVGVAIGASATHLIWKGGNAVSAGAKEKYKEKYFSSAYLILGILFLVNLLGYFLEYFILFFVSLFFAFIVLVLSWRKERLSSISHKLIALCWVIWAIFLLIQNNS